MARQRTIHLRYVGPHDADHRYVRFARHPFVPSGLGAARQRARELSSGMLVLSVEDHEEMGSPDQLTVIVKVPR